MHTHVHSSTIYNIEIMEPTQVSINIRVDYKTMGNTHNEILLSNKEQNYIICKKIEEPGEHYVK